MQLNSTATAATAATPTTITAVTTTTPVIYWHRTKVYMLTSLQCQLQQ